MKAMKIFSALVSMSAAISPTYAAGRNADLEVVVKHKFDAVNRHDLDALKRIYADEATLQSPDYPHLAGNAAIAATYAALFDAMPDAQTKVESIEVAGTHVYARFTLTGHYKGASTEISVPIISIYTINGNRIAQDVTYYDRKPPNPK